MKPVRFQDESISSIDSDRQRYPQCIVWTPLPLITWILPFIGHTGICTSEGVIHDFAGPYTIGIDDMAFGNPTKYVRLDPVDKYLWDNALEQGDRIYSQRMHNLFCDNCHSHVACVMNKASYHNQSWNMVKVWWLTVTRSQYVSWGSLLQTYLGFLILSVVLGLSLGVISQ